MKNKKTLTSLVLFCVFASSFPVSASAGFCDDLLFKIRKMLPSFSVTAVRKRSFLNHYHRSPAFRIPVYYAPSNAEVDGIRQTDLESGRAEVLDRLHQLGYYERPIPYHEDLLAPSVEIAVFQEIKKSALANFHVGFPFRLKSKYTLRRGLRFTGSRTEIVDLEETPTTGRRLLRFRNSKDQWVALVLERDEQVFYRRKNLISQHGVPPSR